MTLLFVVMFVLVIVGGQIVNSCLRHRHSKPEREPRHVPGFEVILKK